MNSDSTLRSQVGLTLKARCMQLNKQFGLELTVKQFRILYKAAKVTQQQLRPRLGAPKLKSRLDQMLLIEQLQRRVDTLKLKGYEII